MKPAILPITFLLSIASSLCLAADAPVASQRTTALVRVHAQPSPAAKVVYVLQPGAAVYPTGQRNGIWMEVDDENGNRGWMSSAMATSR